MVALAVALGVLGLLIALTGPALIARLGRPRTP